VTLRGYSDDVVELTPRMLDVLRCAASGSTAAATARELGISESTVWSVRAALCARLRVPTTPAAVQAARDLGARL
jgi:DNA-binding CsgD family transcriptional regulator